jgi:glutathione S-transferase
MELYGFGESGNAFKVAFALQAMEVDWRLRKVDFFGGETRTPEFRALNPMGEVPVLVDGDTVLSQSGVILDYLASRTGRFAGRSAAERREVLRWLFWDNHKFTGQVATLRFLGAFAPPDKRSAEVTGFLEARITAACKVLDAHLTGREWLVGTGPTVADFSVCGYLWYPEPHGVDRRQWPGIDAWLDRLAALPGWRHPYELMPRAFPGAATPSA